ncbi:MAG TPA: DUF4440 domain-containing protein [Candidatus Angelobacter sp.]
MPNHTFTRYIVAVLIVFCLTVGTSTARSPKDQRSELTPDSKKAIRAAIESYRTAWLANDAKRVLKTLTDDAVLLPAHGTPAVVGIAAIEKYWFAPGGPVTTVTGLNITVDQIGGNGTVAFARGLDEVAWTVTQDGVTHRHFHPGTYLNVMKKLPDGTWRIQVHMWDDGPERVD